MERSRPPELSKTSVLTLHMPGVVIYADPYG
jgi:hypothetical protein